MKTLNIIAGTFVLSILLYSCDKNEFAPDIVDQEYSVEENSPDGTFIGIVDASDRDEGQALSYAIIDGNDGRTFALDANTGSLSVADVADLDYETTTEFNISVSVSDGHKKEPLESAAAIRINVLDVNEHTPQVDGQVFELSENPSNGDEIGTIIASNEEPHQNLTYIIEDLNDEGFFQIDPHTGILSVADSTGFDYELNQQLSLLVKVEDDHAQALSDTAYIRVNIVDVYEPLPGLVAYYPFNENANDESGNGHNGTIYGATFAPDRKGKEESACYFDGSLSYIDLGNSPDLKRYQSDYTVCGWIKLDEYPSTYNSIILSNRNHLITDKPGSFIGVGGLLSSLSKKLEFVQNTIPTDDEFTFDYTSSNTELELDSWYFFAVSYEYQGNLENTIKIYINGNFEAQKQMGEVLDPGDAPTYLGCEPALGPVEYSFHGIMDDIEFYNRALTETEILTRFSE